MKLSSIDAIVIAGFSSIWKEFLIENKLNYVEDSDRFYRYLDMFVLRHKIYEHFETPEDVRSRLEEDAIRFYGSDNEKVQDYINRRLVVPMVVITPCGSCIYGSDSYNAQYKRYEALKEKKEAKKEKN